MRRINGWSVLLVAVLWIVALLGCQREGELELSERPDVTGPPARPTGAGPALPPPEETEDTAATAPKDDVAEGGAPEEAAADVTEAVATPPEPQEPPMAVTEPLPDDPATKAAPVPEGEARKAPACVGVLPNGKAALMVVSNQAWGDSMKYRLAAEVVAAKKAKAPLVPVVLANQESEEGQKGFPEAKIQAQIDERLPQLNAQVAKQKLLACYQAPGRPSEPGFEAKPKSGPVRVFARDGALHVRKVPTDEEKAGEEKAGEEKADEEAKTGDEVKEVATEDLPSCSDYGKEDDEASDDVTVDLPGPDWKLAGVWYHPTSPYLFVAITHESDQGAEQKALLLTP